MSSNKVSRIFVDTQLQNNRTLTELKENDVKVFDMNGNELDATDINGLKKAHVTMSRLYPYMYDAIHNIINDKNYKEYISKSDRNYYTITIKLEKYVELALGNKKNYHQKAYLLKELKTFKAEDKLVFSKNENNDIVRTLAPPIMRVLNADAKKVLSNLDNKEYFITSTITLYFLKPLFFDAVEKQFYSFFYMPKNLYAKTKRLFEVFNELKNMLEDTNTDIQHYSDTSIQMSQKTIYYLLAKNNKTSKSIRKKDGKEKQTSSKMNINLYEFAKYIYPHYIRPNTKNPSIRNRELFISEIKTNIAIYNVILIQDKDKYATLTLSIDIKDNKTTNEYNDIEIPIVEYSQIEGGTLTIISPLLLPIMFLKDTDSFIFKNTQSKKKLKKSINSFKHLVETEFKKSYNPKIDYTNNLQLYGIDISIEKQYQFKILMLELLKYL